MVKIAPYFEEYDAGFFKVGPVSKSRVSKNSEISVYLDDGWLWLVADDSENFIKIDEATLPCLIEVLTKINSDKLEWDAFLKRSKQSG